jgi:hypothetical protein
MFKPTLFLLLSLCCVNVAYASMEIHEHKEKDIGVNTPIPKIEIQVFRDTMDGINIHVEVENYVINAPNIAKNPAGLTAEGVLQGHAHVFVNAEKLCRLYGSDLHIPATALKEGVNQVAVSLNSHQHENWISGKHAIVSSVFFDLSKDPIVLHNFTSQPLQNDHSQHQNKTTKIRQALTITK